MSGSQASASDQTCPVCLETYVNKLTIAPRDKPEDNEVRDVSPRDDYTACQYIRGRYHSGHYKVREVYIHRLLDTDSGQAGGEDP